MKLHSLLRNRRVRTILALSIPGVVVLLAFFGVALGGHEYNQSSIQITATYHGDPTVTITYNSSSTATVCNGNNPYNLLLNGCIVPAIVDEYSNNQNNPDTVGLQIFIGALLIIPDIAILINSENAFIFLLILGSGIGILGYLLPSDIVNLAEGLLMVCVGVILWFAFKPKGS